MERCSQDLVVVQSVVGLRRHVDVDVLWLSVEVILRQAKLLVDIFFSIVAVVHFDLNKVDSAGLESLPFLGPVLASRVCKFRDRLGGFWSVNQLREVWGLKSEVADQIIVMKMLMNGHIHN